LKLLIAQHSSIEKDEEKDMIYKRAMINIYENVKTHTNIYIVGETTELREELLAWE
jgi:hypothetical protein